MYRAAVRTRTTPSVRLDAHVSAGSCGVVHGRAVAYGRAIGVAPGLAAAARAARLSASSVGAGRPQSGLRRDEAADVAGVPVALPAGGGEGRRAVWRRFGPELGQASQRKAGSPQAASTGRRPPRVPAGDGEECTDASVAWVRLRVRFAIQRLPRSRCFHGVPARCIRMCPALCAGLRSWHETTTRAWGASRATAVVSGRCCSCRSSPRPMSCVGTCGRCGTGFSLSTSRA